MKKICLLIVILLAVSCASIPEVKKYVELAPLAADTPVAVYYQLPNFDFKLICGITITESGYKKDPKAFEERIMNEARQCGADMAFVSDNETYTSKQTGYSSTPVYGNSYSSRPTGYITTPYSYDSVHTYNISFAIQKTSDVQHLDLERTKKLRAALDVRNDGVVKVLLKPVSTNRTTRYTGDTFILDIIYFQETNDGLKCRPSILKILKDYNSQVTTLEMKYSEYRSEKATDLIYCGNVLKESYAHITDKKSVVKYVHEKMAEFLNYYVGSVDDLKRLQKISSVLPVITAEIKSACKEDETSEICILKPTFDELRQVIQGMGRKIAPAHRQQFKKTEEMFII